MKIHDEIAAATKKPMIRGKWSNLLEKGSNVAVLDLDLAEQFPDSASVNRALRVYLQMKEQFASLHSAPQDTLGGRGTPLPFDPRNGKRTGTAATAE